MPRFLPRASCFLPVLALLLGAALQPPPAGAQPGPPVTCQDLRDLGLEVSLSDRDLGGGDERGFCLVARPEEDTFIGYLANVAGAEQFRAAKQRYAEAITSGGFDVCRVGVWRPLNREGSPPLPLTAADQLDVPADCAPRLVARDEGAARWLAPVQDALAPIVARVNTDLGVAPHRPLTVDLYTDTDALVAAATAAGTAAGRPIDAEAAARIARGGRSLTVLTPTRGVFMLLNLTRSPEPDTLRRRLAHEYTHYVQSAAGGTLDAYPMWFLEGLAELEMTRLAGAETDQRADAARRERDGTAPRLADLLSAQAWAAAETRLGSGAVYSRAYSAVAFLAERWGATAVTRLLAAASDTDPARFDGTLAEITGGDLDGLDQALGAWLRALGGRVTFYNDSPLSQRLLLSDGRTVELPACSECTFLTAGGSCRVDGRPSVALDLPAGDYEFLHIVPDDRVHFPDSTLRLRIEPGSALSRCLALRV